MWDLPAIKNTIDDGIKRDIGLLRDTNSYRGCLILTYCAIDAMAFLSMPPKQRKVEKADFKAWATKYVGLCSSKKVSADELYAERCSLLHSYGTPQPHRQCAILTYMSACDPECVRRLAGTPNEYVVVSIRALVRDVLDGIDRFTVEAFVDPCQGPLFDRRIRDFMHAVQKGHPVADGVWVGLGLQAP